MTSHLLSLADLHAAAPGVLDTIFGPDGDFEGAPNFTGPASSTGGWIAVASDHEAVTSIHLGVGGRGRRYHDENALDLRIPSVAARLAGLCWRAGYPDLMFQDNEVIAQARHGGPSWNEAWAVRLAALTLALAPRIAALRSTP